MIYYFSGTGNSKWVAESLAALTGDKAVDIAPLIRNKVCTAAISVGSGERIGLVFPIYAWGAPKIIEEFVASVSIDPSAYAYVVCTCGDDAGKALQRLRKRFPWRAALSVVMPNNYIPMYDVDDPALTERKTAAARALLPEIAEKLNANEAFVRIHQGALAGLKTAIVNPIFRTFAVSTKPFCADDSCIGCGQCEKICPRHAIAMTDGRPAWIKKHCLQCMACINRCPAKAIQYGEETRARGRYFFQE